jgi:glutamate formiminotransferase
MNRIIECVPNFSEGRDSDKIEEIASSFRNRDGVKFLDIQKDGDHNRSVITVVGEPDPLKEAVILA